MSETPDPVTQSQATELVIDEQKFENAINQKLAEMKSEQNLVKAIVFGAVAAAIGAALWTLLTVMSGMQFGYAAIGIGFLVGFAVKIGGKGMTPVYGIIGGAFALLSCVFGNYFSMIGIVSSETGMSYSETMKLIPMADGIKLLFENFEFMDVLFYGLAGFFGYTTSIHSLDEDELAAIAQDCTRPQAH